ncbi:hypothetical protein GCE9029_03239 [Grimontia celer]|uniref:Uncharacterized protein n=1 Tax=Grimontia celer TaxID=1796497 RepID=A0A128F829_9GAMM|nr:hypothetical protein [Grimontia celer]CZF82451.1 hypothetical protein GCE9029_03239 [Grimontia celer]
MLKDEDFKIDHEFFHFRKDQYALWKIKDARVKELSLLDNLLYIFFWIWIFSGGVWLAYSQFQNKGVLGLALVLTGLGAFSIFKRAKYSLQLEINHADTTGVQWVNVKKTNKEADRLVLEKQVMVIKELKTG